MEREIRWALAMLVSEIPAVTIAQDRRPIDIERPSTDVSAFELGAPHAGAHPLDDQIGSAFTTMSSTM